MRDCSNQRQNMSMSVGNLAINQLSQSDDYFQALREWYRFITEMKRVEKQNETCFTSLTHQLPRYCFISHSMNVLQNDQIL